MKKRILSLLLALTCVLSLSAPAFAFTDSEEITYGPAIGALITLGVARGKDDGSFDPKGPVTRAEAARLMTLMAFGGQKPVIGVKPTPSFSDIQGHWAEAEIEYCASSGIILGRGDGIFSPDDSVTGTEFAKMCLGLLGYEADVFGLTGPDWAISTNALSNYTSVRLYNGLMEEMDPNGALDREQAAQMLFNALKATPMVKKPAPQSDGTVTFTFEKADPREDGSPMTLVEMQFGIPPEECLPDYPQPVK